MSDFVSNRQFGNDFFRSLVVAETVPIKRIICMPGEGIVICGAILAGLVAKKKFSFFFFSFFFICVFFL